MNINVHQCSRCNKLKGKSQPWDDNLVVTRKQVATRERADHHNADLFLCGLETFGTTELSMYSCAVLWSHLYPDEAEPKCTYSDLSLVPNWNQCKVEPT